VSKQDLVPVYYSNQNRNSAPAFVETRANLKLRRKSGNLNGGYQQNGTVFILYSMKTVEVDTLGLPAGSGFETAWGIKQSGYGGPLVWQMKTNVF
jgi:hypothetical protein